MDPRTSGVKRRYDATSRQERARLTRARVLDTALRLFTETGYAATTVQQVATGAGVSAGIDLALTHAAAIAGPEVAQTIQVAREEVERFSGRQFDPEVVRVFLEMPDTIWEDLRKEINSQIDHFTYPMKQVAALAGTSRTT